LQVKTGEKAQKNVEMQKIW